MITATESENTIYPDTPTHTHDVIINLKGAWFEMS